MPKQYRVLFVVTSHAQLGDTGKPTGVWLEELAAPYLVLANAGAVIDIASPLGGPVPLDPGSVKLAGEEPKLDDFRVRPEVAVMLTNARRTANIDPSEYDAMFLPGGHGTMWDMPNDSALAKLVGAMADASKPIAAVCHGPAGLVSALDKDGTPVVAGRKVNAFTNAEEAAVGLTGIVPFLLQSRLSELGARFESGPDFKPYVVSDRGLITGQNPASSVLVVEALARALGLDLAAKVA